MRRISISGAIVSSVLAILLLSVSTASQGRRVGQVEVEEVNNRAAAAREVLVRWRAPVQRGQLAQLVSGFDTESAEAVGRSGAFRVRSKSMSAAALLAALSKRADVAYAEPNFIVRAFGDPSDAFFPHLWGLKNVGQPVNGSFPGIPGADIRAAEAWETSLGSGSTVVAVIDTGIDYTHADLSPNMWSAPAAFTVTIGGVPITCQAGTHGFNAIQRTCNPMDDHNHGTHVAGTIGAAGNNGVGVVGVNWIASVMGLKFLDAAGSGTIGDAIDAIEFAIQVKQAFGATGGANVRVLSNSWGGLEFSQALLDQVRIANDHEMLFVAAAGNYGFPNDVFPIYPASFDSPNVVAVAATSNTDDRAFFSNYGAQSVHLGAPGVDILSTIRNNAYGFMSGTSMAAPHVSGAAALVLSQCLLDTAQLKATLLGSTDQIPSMAATTITGGRLNVSRPFRACSAPPDVPATLSAFSGDRQIRLAWSAAAGATRYVVKRSTTAGGPYTVVSSSVWGTQYTDVGLINGTTYYYVVSATNVLGESADSPEASATPKLPSDLVVSALTSAATAVAGSPLVVSVTTKNQGTGAADPSTTRFYLSLNTAVDGADVRLDQVQAVPALAPAASVAASITLGIPTELAPGLYYVIARADADDVLLESQENNNTRTRQVSVGPDLFVSALTVPAVAGAGTPMAVSYTVGNKGAAAAPASSLRFYWSANSGLDATDTPLLSQDIAIVAPAGGSSGQASLTVPSGVATGTYYVIAEADSSKAVQEALENNNTVARAVRIGGDLVMSAFSTQAALGAGATFVVSDTTKNTGGSPVGASVTSFYLSSDLLLSATDTFVGSRSVNPLAAGEASVLSTTLTLPAGTSVGSYFLFAKADGGNSVTETQETNNSAGRGVGVGPDLSLSITSATTPVPAGSPTLITDSVTNTGGGDAAPSIVRYYLSTNSVFEAGDPSLAAARSIPSLAAGASSNGSTSATIPAGTTPGNYYVIARADSDQSVAESSETNNTRARLIRVD